MARMNLMCTGKEVRLRKVDKKKSVIFMFAQYINPGEVEQLVNVIEIKGTSEDDFKVGKTYYLEIDVL